MSDSSNPSVNRVDDETEATPYDAGSSASSLGAPAPSDQSDPTSPDDAVRPETDIHGDPDQVS